MATVLKKDVLNHLIGNTGAPYEQKDCIDTITRGSSNSLQSAWNTWAGTTSNPRTINECAKIITGLTNQTVTTQECLEFLDPVAAISETWDVLLWLDAGYEVYTDAGTTKATNGQTVQQWNSKAVSLNASQSTAASRPIYFASVANGRPGILFDASDDFMSFSQITTSSAYLIAYVATNSDGTNGSNILGFTSSNAWYVRDNVTGSEGVKSNIASSAATAVGETNGIHLGMVTSIGAGPTGNNTYINNSSAVQSTGSAFITDGINAAAADSPTFLPGGFIHEIMILQSNIPILAELESARLYIKNYLSVKWGLGL